MKEETKCSDTVAVTLLDWVTGMVSSLENAGCWFAGGDELTGALHVL